MPGNSAGSVQKPRPHGGQTGRAAGEGQRRSRAQSRDSSASQESSREPCLEPSRLTDMAQGRKPHPRSANGRDSETLGFIPGSADSAPAVRTCGPCTPPGWGGCRALFCCIVTCGLYGSREPCLSSPNRETSTDDPAPPDPQDCPPNGVAMTTGAVRQEPRPAQPLKLLPSDSFRYGDLRIGGKKVDYAAVGPPRRSRPPGARAGGESQRPVSNTSVTSVYSREELDFLDDLSDSGTDIDSLITKKLLELYKLHQIDQLAKCTSDSSFSRKTNEISDLIYSIAQDYNLEEQEAECRLVHGVIRISTRKSKRSAPRAKEPAPPLSAPLNGRRDGTLPDSGNETMMDTFYSNDTEPEVKVSQQTPSDALARQMRMNSGREYSPSSPTAFSPSPHYTETDSSGTPLLHYIRT
ncbi:keratinocyte differentiation factor 1 [Anguilla rostrata]|uniref:keratinocyte differentiation factor 1 n=1 Tax=Anguilla rostrata TaxID=7938 RepID=UPI0030D5097A